MVRRKSDALFLLDERDCWVWLRSVNSRGYGLKWRSDQRRLDLAHRWTYELVKGPIQPGLEIDHLCRVQRCVNPDHLEAVTRKEHVKRTQPDRVRIDHGPEPPKARQVDPAACILWTGCVDRNGYGGKSVNGRRMMAHRWAYEQRYGPIPSGLEIDHLCRVHACVNPEHLEAVTHRENTRRANHREACVHGHAYIPENTLWERDGKRKCRTCRAAMYARDVQRRRGLRGEA